MGVKRRNRMESVKSIVLERGAVTAQELATELGTSRRTIYRYIDSLRKQGLFIEACPGSTGGFRLAQAASNRNLLLSDAEASAVLLVGSAVSMNNLLPYNDHLEGALEKVRRSLSESAWAEIRDAMPNVSVLADRLWGDGANDHYLNEITDAIAHKQGIKINYCSLRSDEQIERKIDPYHLFYQGGAWYVAGYCHLRKSIRTFRVDRMKELNIEERTFERPSKFSLYEYLGSAWGMVRGEKRRVKIRFSSYVARLIAESQWHPSQQISFENEGSVLFTADVEGVEEIRRWVLTFAEHAEVLEPTELRESLTTSLSKMLSLYQSPQPGEA